jgi:hypothetical protein
MVTKGRLNVRSMLAVFSLAAVVTAASVALAAGGVSSATVSSIQIGSGNTATVFFTPPLSNGACQVTTAMIWDHSTTRGKNILTLLTSAQLSGKKVDLGGTGTCTTITGLTWETISTVSITNN